MPRPVEQWAYGRTWRNGSYPTSLCFPKKRFVAFVASRRRVEKKRRDAQGSPPLLRSRAHASLSRSRKSSSRISLGENFRHSHSLKIKYLRSELFNHVNSERGETILLPYRYISKDCYIYFKKTEVALKVLCLAQKIDATYFASLKTMKLLYQTIFH